MHKLIDSHAHLDQLSDIEGALMRAKEAGLLGLVAVGTDYESSLRLLEISKAMHPIKVFIALGVHPTEIQPGKIEPTLKLIEDNINNIVAIGEIGLDYWHKTVKKDKTKKERQKEIYRQQLKLAKKHAKPVSIHSRGAWEDCLTFCLEETIEKAVFHWYSGPVDILKKACENNYFISATPSLGYSAQHRDAIKEAPLAQLLIETDSPVYFGKPESGGFSAEPKDVVRTLELVAQLKNIPKEEIAAATLENAKNFFGIGDKLE